MRPATIHVRRTVSMQTCTVSSLGTRLKRSERASNDQYAGDTESDEADV